MCVVLIVGLEKTPQESNEIKVCTSVYVYPVKFSLSEWNFVKIDFSNAKKLPCSIDLPRGTTKYFFSIDNRKNSNRDTIKQLEVQDQTAKSAQTSTSCDNDKSIEISLFTAL